MKLKPTNSSTCPALQRKTSLVQVLVLLSVHCLFEGQQNEWVPFACDETGPADESKRTKRVWDGLIKISWVVVLIVVSLYIRPQ